MAIASRAASSGDIVGTSTVTLTKPTGTAATDVLVVSFVGAGPGGPGTVTPPAGWTAIASNVGSGDVRGACYWALGSVTALAFTRSVAGDTGWACVAFTGVDNTTPIDATGTTSTVSAATTITANAVTVVTSNSWHLIAFGAFNAGTATATGFTVAGNGGAGANQPGDLLYNTTPKSTGSTGTVSCARSGVATGQILTAIPFALRPAGAAGGGGPFPWFLDDAQAGGLQVMGI
jgi:hypothetical protein